jgi:ERCC4-related helicase
LYPGNSSFQVISRFQSGNYNVLVSTSIGEEGLDIGQVDLIVCYDSQNSPIRMLQRMGRTGRKRQGRVVLLLTQGKEEESYKKAQAQYKSVQVPLCNGMVSLITSTNSNRTRS